MKKRPVLITIFIFCCSMLSLTVSAAAPTAEDVTDALPRQARDTVEGTALSPETEKTLENLWEQILEAAGVYGRNALTGAGAVMAIAFLCTAASSAFGIDKGKTPDYTVMAGALGIMAVSAGNVHTFLEEAKTVVETLGAFSKTLLPALAAAAAASGMPALGTAGYAVTAFFMDVLVTVAEHAAVPLVYGFAALSFGAAALDNEGLRAGAKLMRTVVIGFLTVLMLTFTIFLTTAGAITGTADATATKLTKTAISTVLPVVGGIVSDAAAAVVNGAGMMKNSVGLFGLLAVCGVCVLPVVKLVIHTLTYRLAGAFAAAVAEPRLSGLISAIGEAVGMMLGIAGACAMMLFLSITCLIRVGTGG